MRFPASIAVAPSLLLREFRTIAKRVRHTLRNLGCNVPTLAESLAAAACQLFVAFRSDPSEPRLLLVEVWNMPLPGSQLPKIGVRRSFPAVDFISSGGVEVAAVIESAVAELR